MIAKKMLANYGLVYLSLLLLLALNVSAAFFHLGTAMIAIAILLATCSMLLIARFYMEVRLSARLTLVFAVGSLVWLAILIGFSLTDYLTRS